jgi:hypothetical protein
MARGPRAIKRKPAVDEPQPLDAFEADDQLPAEEQPKNANKRYDVSCCCGDSCTLFGVMHWLPERGASRGMLRILPHTSSLL